MKRQFTTLTFSLLTGLSSGSLSFAANADLELQREQANHILKATGAQGALILHGGDLSLDVQAKQHNKKDTK